MTIVIPLNILLRKEQKILLNPPPSTYPGVLMTLSYNTSSNRKNYLIRSDISRDIDCGDEKYSGKHRDQGDPI